LDAELLVADALQMDRLGLYLDFDRPLAPLELERVREHVERRRAYEPVAYLLGHREFYGRSFEVNSFVLVPRPETELLVERVLALISSEEDATILDIGTGSGAIAVTLAAERPSLIVDATDISPSAIQVAQRNAHHHGVGDRVRFLETDLFPTTRNDKPYDVIVSNPPYIRESEIETLQPDVAKHEPHVALNGGSDGLDVFRRIAEKCAGFLGPRGAIVLEVGAGQAESVSKLFFQAFPASSVQIHRDLARIERVVEITTNA
jgi:release factor glutamine methyltransferase